jgi:deoxyribonuclease V
VLEGVAPYEPGALYKRELPGILELLKSIELYFLNAILIDGYVFLDDEGKPGLGAYLYEAIGGAVPIIGVAKTHFATVHHRKREVRRGNSIRPLFITAIGIEPDSAAALVGSMHGAHRLPTILKLLDRLTRQ